MGLEARSLVALLAFTSASSSGAGPDLAIGEISTIASFGRAGDVAAYAFGVSACNLGDEAALWQASTNLHPVFSNGLYRLKDGALTQIGVSHLAHGFFALAQSVCQPCTGPGGAILSPGCADTTSATLVGSQQQLSPRTQLDAFLGAFPFPFESGAIQATVGRRCQVAVDDVDPALNDGAVYWAETLVVSADDAAAGNGLNNASNRRVVFGANPASFPALYAAPTQGQRAVVEAWADLDPTVLLGYADIPGEGRIIVASRASENPDSTWTYTYAVFNLNSDLGVSSFAVDLSGAGATDAWFHSPAYHSGDGLDGVTIPNTPWGFALDADAAAWATESFDENPNANALRWGTTYSFSFVSPRGPGEREARLGLFKPGGPASVPVAALAPACALMSDANGDGVVNFADLNIVLAEFGQSGPGMAGDVVADGVVNFADLNAVLSQFGDACD